METTSDRIVGIVGLGLIGGSMALDLKRRGFARKILGVENDALNASAAERLGLADEIVSLEDCVRRSDIVVIAVPVGAAIGILRQVLDLFRTTGTEGGDKIVIDTCSAKGRIVQAAEGHPLRSRYVSTHPMAGTEYSGPWAAMPNLFDGHACIVTDSGETAPDALRTVEAMYEVLNMRTIWMSSDQHDVHTAYVSHISHITSFALALTVLDKEKDEKHIFDLASGGFSSTVRLAKSSAEMWVPILTQNRDNILHVLDTYLDKMQAFRNAIAEDDAEQIEDLIRDANRIKKIIR